MKYTKYSFLFLCVVLHTACIIINTKGRLVDIDKVESNDLKLIEYVPENSSICNIANNGHIYSITAAHLGLCLKKNPRSVVYTWSPNCHGKSCILISACQEYCRKNNYELYVVADYYDMEVMKAQNNAIHPIMIANHQNYKTKNGNRLEKKFLSELIPDENGKKILKKNYFRFYYFENGILKQIAEDVSELKY